MFVAAAVAAFLTAATAAVVLGVKFLGRGVANELNEAAVAHGLACQLVVEVHEHLVIGHLDDLTLDAHAFLSHHGHACTRTDVLGVKLAVDVENLLLELIDQLGILYAESLMRLQREIKLLALLQTHDVVLEALDERQIHSKDESVGVLLVELEHTRLLVAIDHEYLIHEFYVFSCLNFLH